MSEFEVPPPRSPVPLTTFPDVAPDSVVLSQDQLHLCLINSDPSECNQNLSTYIKCVAEKMAFTAEGTNYHQLSVYAMKLITSNLFIRNYKLCIGKLLALLTVFTNVKNFEVQTGAVQTCDDDDRMKEFVCIVFFLLLKFKNSEDEEPDMKEFNDVVDAVELFDTLRDCSLIAVVANFITCHIQNTKTSFVLLKVCCDSIFEYLFHVELLCDQEFDDLVARSSLIATIIDDLLNNKSFHNYDINDLEWEDEDKLIAYEEFKLLLLINEQYLMKSYSSPGIRNKVFDGLMSESLEEGSESVNSKISGFLNVLVYHINREESQIIKILILKFLYLVFTSSYTSKLYYLNDLKILMDIFIRELEDIEYMEEENAENRILVLTYLKVMYPMTRFSQMADLVDGYRRSDIVAMLSNIVSNISASSEEDQISQSLKQISDLASKCMSVPWLKKKNRNIIPNSQANSSSSSLNSSSSLSRPILHKTSSSTESIANSFTRVASVRTYTRNDYHLHTTKHNIDQNDWSGNLAQENNHNMFLQGFNSLGLSQAPSEVGQEPQKRQSNILDLPNEYLSAIPDVNDKHSRLLQKAMRKRAPPPPQSPRFCASPIPSALSSPSLATRSGPPPPPPPRRRH
ncbi:pre-rRNA processing [Yamadazyma tenuis]|nr:pre-rRNA processing [Yamadazyma tenuis]